MGFFKSQLTPDYNRKNEKPARRKYRRFPVALAASYGLNGDSNGRCQLCNISAEGMAIKISPEDKITPCNNLKVSIPLPSRSEPVSALLNVRWINEQNSREDFSYIAGGLLRFPDSRAKASLLEYAYTNWFKTVA